MQEKVDKIFQIRASRSSPLIEVRAGLTTFVTMSYILLVNPLILGQAIPIEGIFPQLLTSTALVSGVGCWLMAFLARSPFALAPGMGMNSYFALSLVLGLGVPWQTALGAVFISGALFVLLSLFRIREVLTQMIPDNLKYASSAGLGLFLAMIGLQNAGIIVKHEHTLVTLGDLHSPATFVALIGLVATLIFLAFRWRGAIVLGIVLATAFAILAQMPVYGGRPFAGFSDGWLRFPQMPKDLWLSLDLKSALTWEMSGVIATFIFMLFFDTAGSLVGLSQLAGFPLQKDSHDKRMRRAFLSDALATTLGSLLGVSPSTCFMESATGIKEGGRTGLTAFTVGTLFFLSLFFWPLAGVVSKAATAPALIVIGSFMMASIRSVDWDDITSSFPAFLTLLMIPLTFSIANGVSFGILSYVLLKVCTGRYREVSILLYLFAALLTLRFFVH